VAIAIFAFLAALLPPPVSSPSPADSGGGGTAVCQFTNPGYSGTCTERVSVPGGSTAEKSCGEILQCLNSTGCTKTYCQSTTIRSGWRLESAKIAASRP
jgi:hypothetical protein